MNEDECSDFWRQAALDIPAEDVGDYLEVFSGHLDEIRYQTEVFRERHDISEEDRCIADRIYGGLEAWSELIFDSAE
jgi:hypothetical protein